MKTLLITTHAPTPNTQTLAHAAKAGAMHADLRDATGDLPIKVVCKAALDTVPDDVLAADAILIGTTENIGYMGGLTKDFFDRCYYPVLEKKQGLAVAAYIRAGLDGTGTTRALESIITGLRWQWVQTPLVCKGTWHDDFPAQVEALAMGMAAGLDAGIY